ncbi:MAG: c-type cytochrome [Deltaproteobacteria bacterium]|nr:c-type cytochrome [Deltaproteobacteria bacterium]
MTRLVIALSGLVFCVACSDKSETLGGPGARVAEKPSAVAAPAEKPADTSASDEAKAIYAARCVGCHGEGGNGNGKAAAALNPRPRDFSQAAWQAQIQDAAIEKIILGGGVSVGKSPMMPPSPDLADKPATVAALRALVRSFKK